MDGLFSRVYHWSNIVAQLMYVNTLWVGFTILGLGIFGFFPATVAMFSVMRKWIMGERELPIVATFWAYYKSDFKQANILGYLLVIIGLLLYVDLKFFQAEINPGYGLISLVFLSLLFWFCVILLYIFPLYVHYDFPIFHYIKHAIILSFARPLQTMAMLVGGIAVYLLFQYFPGLVFFLGGSLFAYILMFLAYFSFQKEQEA